MTVLEMRKKLDCFCNNQMTCDYCALYTDEFKCGRGFHFLSSNRVSDDEVKRAYDLILNNSRTHTNNPYWERITQISNRQRKKGINTYGQGLEANTVPDALKRIEAIQEELIDALMYLEWLKDVLKGETENGT